MSKDGTPEWAYNEDGYCVCCGNGNWKYHMPECELRDGLDAARRVANPDYEAAWRVWYQMNFWPWWMRWLQRWLRTPIKLMVDAALGVTEAPDEQ